MSKGSPTLEEAVCTGLHANVPRETYDNLAFLNASTVKNVLRSSKSAAHAIRKSSSDSPALRFGTAFHTYILEADLFNDEIAVAPEVDKRTTAGKAKFADFAIASKGKTIISKDDHRKLQRMSDEIYGHELAASYLDDERGLAELTAVWNPNEHTAADSLSAKENRFILPNALKGRLDWLTPNAIVDIKTCADASPRGVQRSAVQFGYHVQAAFYRELFRRASGSEDLLPFVFVFVEKEAPHGVLVVELDEMFLEIGWTQTSRAIDTVQDWMMFGHSDYAGGRKVTIECPQWLAQQFKGETESEYNSDK